MERLLRVQDILALYKTRHGAPAAPEAENTSQRSTNPDAPMELVLRFTTEFGPRTIIASGVPLKTASAITLEMMRAGHLAEYADQRPRPVMTAWARGWKNNGGVKPRTLLKLAASTILEAAS